MRRLDRGWTRAWPALVLVLFCLPLFVGLGRTDLGHDESIYSFAVDRMLETGDWLVPKSIPNEDWAFLEKPPLKIWIVAASIRLGLVPPDEFGMRFWDAVFGGAAFLYVFAIGRRLAGPVCGVVAVLILFAHQPLIFEHGLRSNNMEAALLLCYCGGVYHFLAWTDQGARRAWHAVGVALCFVLGFMTKFVAALFLPLLLGAAGLLVGAHRAQLRREWRLWVRAGLVAVALCVPWFIYAWVEFGTFFWEVIVGGHVYTRFTSFVDPLHVQPWHYYFSSGYRALVHAQTAVIVGAGLAWLVVQTIRRRRPEGVVILLWFILPVTLMSLGTSKLYHYLYPFLPPLALAGGVLPAVILGSVPAPTARWIQDAMQRLVGAAPWIGASRTRPAIRLAMWSVAVAAGVLAVATAFYGPVRLAVGQDVLLRNASIIRPLLVAVAAGALAGHSRRAVQFAVVMLVIAWLPLSPYRTALTRLTAERHPLRDTLECLSRARTDLGERGSGGPGIYLDAGDVTLPHPVYYYLRRLRPWVRAERPSDAAIYASLYGTERPAPVLLPDWRQREFMARLREGGPALTEQVTRLGGFDVAHVRASASATSPAQIDLDDAVLLLPGPFAACASDVLRERTP